MNQENKLFSTQNLIKMGLLSSIAVLLMQVGIKLPMLFPSFLELDFSDVPAIIGILTVHPLAGIVIPLIKNLLDSLIGSTTGYVGETSNFVIGVAYLLPLIIITRKKRNFKTILIGLLLGIVTMTLTGCFTNYFIMIPLYSKFMPMDKIIQMGTILNPAITDLKSFVFLAIAPFNIFKSIAVSTIGVIVVKAMLPVMKYLQSRHVES